MKKFENKNTTVPAENEAKEKYNLTYAEILCTILDIMPQSGWTIEIMRTRIPLQAKLKAMKPKAVLLLENAEIKILHDIFNSKPAFQIMHSDLIALEDYIAELVTAPDENVKLKNRS